MSHPHDVCADLRCTTCCDEPSGALVDTFNVEPLSLPRKMSPSTNNVNNKKQKTNPSPLTLSSTAHVLTSTPPDRTKYQQPQAPDFIDMPSPALVPKALTVSAVLSRSGQVHALPSRQNSLNESTNTLRKRFSTSSSQSVSETQTLEEFPLDPEKKQNQADDLMSMMPSIFRDLWRQGTEHFLSSKNEGESGGASRSQRAGKYHTGSALEAIGALFLREDSAGRLDQLSLNRSKNAKRASVSQMDLPLWIRHIEAGPLILFAQHTGSRIANWFRQMTQTEQNKKSTPIQPWFTDDDDLPETPLLMPGGFVRDDSDSLMLPPPLLDDQSNDAWSFEGLLGVRRMREQLQRKQYLDAMSKRNRPAHHVDAWTAFTNFVRSAKASEARAASAQARLRSLDVPDKYKNLGWLWPHGSRKGASSTTTFSASQPSSEVQMHSQAACDDALCARPYPKMKDDQTLSFHRSETRRASRRLSLESLDLAMSHEQERENHFAGHSFCQRITPKSMLMQQDTASMTSGVSSLLRESRSSVAADTTTLGVMWILWSYVFVSVAFVPDFVVFFLAHTLDLVMDSFEFLSYAVWFIRWVYRNVMGETVLGRICIEAYFMFQNEWEHVIREDHEESANRMRLVFGIPLSFRPRGISTFQVLRGFIELACIQSVTREQYQREGAGLVRLEYWHKPEMASFCSPAASVKHTPVSVASGGDPPACREEHTSSRQAYEHGNKCKVMNNRYGGEEYDNQEDYDDDDDNDDLVVTSQSVDILELSRSQHARTGGGDAPSYSRDYSRVLWDEDNSMLVRNIKWASQLAMSAYGLRVLIVDLPPVFTPSGKQLPRQTFAHLSRLKADDVLHADIQTLDLEATYAPTFYVVRDMRRKVVCVAVRGTQSFADIVVDLDMKTEDITSSLAEWRGIPVDENTERYLYHAGIWRAAKTLVSPGSTLFRKLCETLHEHEDFGLVFVGHSLGGAIASAATILLSEYHIDAPGTDPRKGIWRTTSQDGFPGGRPIRAITFAHPSTLSHSLNKRTTYGSVPLVVNVILGSDIIPRFGHGQLRELRRVLGALTRVRRRRDMVATTISSNPKHMQEDQEFSVHIVRRFWDWLSICRTEKPDAVMLDRKKRLEDLFWRLRCEVEKDLYVQAKNRFEQALAQHMLASSVPLSPWVRAERYDAPLHTLSARRQRLDYATLKSETVQGGVLVPAGRNLWLSNGELYDITNPLAFFSLPVLHFSMFADHFPAAYEEAILALK